MSFQVGDTVSTKSGNTYVVDREPFTNMKDQVVVTATPASGKGPTRYLTVKSLTLVAPAKVRNAVAEGVEQVRVAAEGPFIGPRSEVTETGNSGTPADGSVTTHSWTRNIGGRPYRFSRILMASGEVRFSVSKYNGYVGGTAFACAWTQAHFLYVDPTQCPDCGHSLMAPAPAGHAGDDSYYCEGCGKAWSREVIETATQAAQDAAPAPMSNDPWIGMHDRYTGTEGSAEAYAARMDAATAADQQRCLDNGGHLLSSRHTRGECSAEETAPEADPIRNVSVIYTIEGVAAPKTAGVALVADYTTEADIPAILAVKHFSDNKRANLITVLDVLEAGK